MAKRLISKAVIPVSPDGMMHCACVALACPFSTRKPGAATHIDPTGPNADFLLRSNGARGQLVFLCPASTQVTLEQYQ